MPNPLPPLHRAPGPTRPCPICGATQTPFCYADGSYTRLTSHEFQCLKADPTRVPEYARLEFASTLAWERRSTRAKAAAQLRKARAQ